jgi:hypothetical protein
MDGFPPFGETYSMSRSAEGRTRKISLWWRWTPLILAAAIIPGCGKSGADVTRASISGKVSLGGEPLKEGRIRFIPETTSSAGMAVATIADGKYSIPADKGPAIGKARVEITSYRNTGKKIPLPDSPGQTEDEKEQFLPEKYNMKSKLRADVQGGENTKDFKLDLK